jgi:single-strand DNA-binding protein
MSNGNTVTVIGNVTRDPELRFTASGQAKANIGLAVNRRWQNRQTSEWEEATSFFNVVAWGAMGENAAESCPKGSRIIVTGRLDQRSWETDNGEKRSVIEIVADEIGPSLRWATAQVTKSDRREGTGGAGGGGGGGGAGGGGSRPAQNEAPDHEFSEEPF